MNLEKVRQQHIKDTEEKDEEMEELRYSTQKKVTLYYSSHRLKVFFRPPSKAYLTICILMGFPIQIKAIRMG